MQHKNGKLEASGNRYNSIIDSLESEVQDLRQEINDLKVLQREFEVLKEEKQTLSQDKATTTESFEKTIFLTRNLKYTKIQNFNIQKILGQGSSGIVFLTEVLLNGHSFQLALKMLFNLHFSTIKLASAFENEFKILYKLKTIHKNIIHILHDFTAVPTPQMIAAADPSIHEHLYKTNFQRRGSRIPKTTQFFVIEYHPQTLEQKLQKLGSSITYEIILKYAQEIVDCFLFLFKNRIVHRDVKLNNILIAEDNRIIVSDFGESIETDKNHCCSVQALRGGNQAFSAPEIINQIHRKEGGTGKIDFSKQYSWEVGCLLFAIAYGDLPFSDYPLNYGRAPNVVVPPVSIPDSAIVPEEFSDVLRRLLLNQAESRMGIEEAHEILHSDDTSTWLPSIRPRKLRKRNPIIIL